MTRLDLITRLAQCQGDINALRARLQDFPFDAEAPLVTLETSHIISVLERFLAGGSSAADVEYWAEAVEGRDDVAYVEGAEDQISEALFVLSTPEINGALTPESAKQLLRQLRHAL
jgi:hypothetical protein